MPDQKRKFNVLSIDGGGIRGVFPAMFLAHLEAKLKADKYSNYKIYQNFDLICGTSTGGIIAIAMALGIPAIEIYNLYIDNAVKIFGNKKWFINQVRNAAHDRSELENIVRNKFKEANNGVDPRLIDCKTNICVPIYDLLQGKPCVLKNNYHKSFVKDYHIPAYHVALSTSAAPLFFDPYSSTYEDLNKLTVSFNNKVDGGVCANNPALLSIVEAQTAFYQPLSNIQLLSIGTGHQTFSDAAARTKWGFWYWVRKDKKTRLVDLFMQGQSQLVQNLISLMHTGIDSENKDKPNFTYCRIDTELDQTLNIKLDETNSEKLKALGEKATLEFQKNANNIIKNFF